MNEVDKRVDPLPVYVLVGGQSRRFGADKAAYEVDGEPWAWHVANRLALTGDPIILVGERPPAEFPARGESIPDSPEAPGPLGGVLAALTDRERRLGPGLLCLASCDLVRPERAWLDPLLHALAVAGDLGGAAYHNSCGWQPFPSILHTSSLPPLRGVAAQGMSSLQDAYTAARILDLAWRLPGEGPPQANTPEALECLLAEP